MGAAAKEEEEEGRHLLGGFGSSSSTAASSARRSSRHGCWWPLAWRRRQPVHLFPRGRHVTAARAVCEPMDEEDFRRHREKRKRLIEMGHFERLAVHRKLVVKCLLHYNSLHPHDEYEPAPGAVTKHMRPHSSGCWTHGNFVARRKRSGCFSSLIPAPRTLFFFELNYTSDFDGVVTCIPLFDEPVTEGYSVLGFPIWWGSRRDGKLDCICKTCYHRVDSAQQQQENEETTLVCGHRSKAERVCEMCHGRSAVLHPLPGQFQYGYREYLYRCYYLSRLRVIW